VAGFGAYFFAINSQALARPAHELGTRARRRQAQTLAVRCD
jgi:hypothetical protein